MRERESGYFGRPARHRPQTVLSSESGFCVQCKTKSFMFSTISLRQTRGHSVMCGEHVSLSHVRRTRGHVVTWSCVADTSRVTQSPSYTRDTCRAQGGVTRARLPARVLAPERIAAVRMELC